MPHLQDFDPDEPPTGRMNAYVVDLRRISSLTDALSGPERELLITLIQMWVKCDHTNRAVLVGRATELALDSP